MRLVNFETPGGYAAGLKIGDEVVDLTALGIVESVDALIAAGPDAIEQVQQVADGIHPRLKLADLCLLPPVMAPEKAIAVGVNYHCHAAEGGMRVKEFPVLFNRFPSSWVGHDAAIIKPFLSDQFDFEVELAVIIGKAGRHIAAADALDHVFGYSVFNDGSVRDYQRKTHQWMVGKNFDRSGSFGPELVTADELPSGAKGLGIRTRLNGVTMQDGNTSEMIFDVASLIEACSQAFELVPGDVIITGTPAGVGLFRDPPLFMQPGDLCEVEIDGIGVLSNPVELEAR